MGLIKFDKMFLEPLLYTISAPSEVDLALLRFARRLTRFTPELKICSG